MVKPVDNESPLTALQAQTMDCLSWHVGQVVDVQTAKFHPMRDRVALSYPPSFAPVCASQMSTLRGLERRGRIKIVDTYWQGARVEVL